MPNTEAVEGQKIILHEVLTLTIARQRSTGPRSPSTKRIGQPHQKESEMKHLLLTAALTVLASGAWAADVAAGKAASGSCAGCHGPTGGGTQMGGKIAGMDQARFIQAMNDYKTGKRNNAMMKSQAGQLSAATTADLAAYYASLK
jgi:cytochrome c553